MLKNPKIIIRPAGIEELIAVKDLCVQSILAVSEDYYSRAQVRAWAKAVTNPEKWKLKFRTQSILVAEGDSALLGVVTFDLKGGIDMFYVHPKEQSKGVGGMLYSSFEEKVRNQGIQEVQVYASDSAKGFFSRMGFELVGSRLVVANGVKMRNSFMRKHLAG